MRIVAAIGVLGLLAIAVMVAGAQLRLFFYRRDQRQPCPACHGTGMILSEDCYSSGFAGPDGPTCLTCEGTGQQRSTA